MSDSLNTNDRKNTCYELEQNSNSLIAIFKDIIRFIKQRKVFSVFILLASFLTYGCQLLYYRISIDNDFLLNDHSYINFHIVIKRTTNVILKYILDYERFNPYVTAFVTIFLIAIFAIVWSFVFNSAISGTKKNTSKYFWILPILFISYPTLAEQFCFLMQSVEVSIAIALCGLSIYCFNEYILNNKFFKFYIFAIIFASLAFGSYQAIVGLFISGVLAYFIIWFFNKDQSKKYNYMKIISLYLVGFIISLILYYCFASIIYLIFVGNGDDYIDNQFKWGILSFKKCIIDIIYYIKYMTFEKNVFSNILFYPISIAILDINIIKLIQNKCSCLEFILIIFATLAFIISPFIMPIALGSYIVPRIQLTMPFWLGFSLFYIISSVNKKVLLYSLLILSFFVAYRNIQKCVQLFYTGYIVYQEDVQLINKISYDIDKKVGQNNPSMPVMYVGKVDARIPNSCVKGEVLGASEFDWYPEEILGVTSRVYCLAKSIGYNYLLPTNEQAIKAKESSENMPVWPQEGSVDVRDGVVIVKLS